MADVRRIDIDFIESTALQPEVTLCAEVLDAAEAAERAGEVTILVHEGREVAAIVPIEVVTQ
jgi:hypothetical protein